MNDVAKQNASANQPASLRIIGNFLRVESKDRKQQDLQQKTVPPTSDMLKIAGNGPNGE
jgi:hypothetical protein